MIFPPVYQKVSDIGKAAAAFTEEKRVLEMVWKEL